MEERDTYVVSLVLLGKHSWNDGMGLKSGAAGSAVGRLRPTPFTEEDGTVAVMVTFKEPSLARRSTWGAWCASELVPFRKLDFAEASSCGLLATTPWATRAAVVPLVIAIAMLSLSLPPCKHHNPNNSTTTST
jgi:hypothetical protein